LDDRDLLDDVMVEMRQAIEMTGIYRDDIKGTRELFSSLLDNRLNNAMKYLTSITLLMAVPTVVSGLSRFTFMPYRPDTTLLMAVPTVVSGLYGMNVNLDGMPLAYSPWGFGILCGLILLICIVSAWVLHKKHML
ncbi:MAG: CorA family divalent cation transporter, partial [Gemmiger sp.]